MAEECGEQEGCPAVFGDPVGIGAVFDPLGEGGGLSGLSGGVEGGGARGSGGVGGHSGPGQGGQGFGVPLGGGELQRGLVIGVGGGGSRAGAEQRGHGFLVAEECGEQEGCPAIVRSPVRIGAGLEQVLRAF